MFLNLHQTYKGNELSSQLSKSIKYQLFSLRAIDVEKFLSSSTGDFLAIFAFAISFENEPNL